jgi:hypothetical protein
MRFLIGIDDTDSPENSSTGELSIRLGKRLEEQGLGKFEAVTRHQLLRSPQVPCTSDNGAICLSFEADVNRRSELEMACRSFILREYTRGADTGFALASWNQLTAEVFTWAKLAKTRLLTRQDALQVARSAKIAIAGIAGSGNGVIGALAAVGLRFRGEDGRFLWLPNLSAMNGVHTYTELMDEIPFDSIETLKGKSPRPEEKIALVAGGITPVLREGRCVLLVEPEHKETSFDWHTLDQKKVFELSD